MKNKNIFKLLLIMGFMFIIFKKPCNSTHIDTSSKVDILPKKIVRYISMMSIFKLNKKLILVRRFERLIFFFYEIDFFTRRNLYF